MLFLEKPLSIWIDKIFERMHELSVKNNQTVMTIFNHVAFVVGPGDDFKSAMDKYDAEEARRSKEIETVIENAKAKYHREENIKIASETLKTEAVV